MSNAVECELMGGPLDGSTAIVDTVPCRCCGDPVTRVGLRVDGILPPPEWAKARRHLRNYIIDEDLKRLTWSPGWQS